MNLTLIDFCKNFFLQLSTNADNIRWRTHVCPWHFSCIYIYIYRNKRSISQLSPNELFPSQHRKHKTTTNCFKSFQYEIKIEKREKKNCCIGMLIVLWFYNWKKKKCGRISDRRRKTNGDEAVWHIHNIPIEKKTDQISCQYQWSGRRGGQKRMVVSRGGAITHWQQLNCFKSSQVQILKEREQTIVHRNWWKQAKHKHFIERKKKSTAKKTSNRKKKVKHPTTIHASGPQSLDTKRRKSLTKKEANRATWFC